MAKRRKVPTVNAKDIFERTVVEMVRECGYHKRYSNVEIDVLVRAMVEGFADTLEEFSIYIENEEWDELTALAARERFRRDLRSPYILKIR